MPAGKLGQTLAAMLERSHHLHPEDLSAVVTTAVEALGGRDVQLYLADLGQDVLMRLSGTGEAELDIDATVAGRAFRTTLPVLVDQRAWVPILDGAERLGVLGALVEDEGTVHDLKAVATLVAELIVARSHYGDAFAVGRRRRALSLASELRWAMLPPLTFATERVTIAAFVAPPYEVAGDCFDYSVAGDLAHVAVFDAMGHGLEASRIVNLAQGAYRHARRTGLDLVETAIHLDRNLNREFGDSVFVTAALAQLDLGRGTVQLILAGHPRPLLLRNHSLVGDLDVPPTLPLGIGDPEPEVCELQLEPDDRLLLYTDGVVEARNADGEPFGVERLADHLVRAQSDAEPESETMRRLSRAIAAHQDAAPEDDATLLSVHWRGPRPT